MAEESSKPIQKPKESPKPISNPKPSPPPDKVIREGGNPTRRNRK